MGSSALVILLTFILIALGHSDDIKPKDWCGTISPSQHNHPKTSVSSTKNVVPFPCAEGKCDDSQYRDDFIAQPNSLMMVMRLYWVVVDNRKTPDEIYKLIDEQVAWLNEAYAPARISFNVSGVYISNDKKFEQIGGTDYGLINRFKTTYTTDPSRMLHIYVTDLLYGLLGRATFPWDEDYLTTNGGIILDRDFYGYKHGTLVHEIGHCLGLWHTHHGWENSIRDPRGNIVGCSLCDEHPGIPTNETGDLCSDTKPTSVNYYCKDPSDKDCNFLPWGQTDYENFMGYAPDNCYTGFTTQQMARMRCWIAESATSLLQDIGCTTDRDCDNFTTTSCTINKCVDNSCEFTGIECDSGEPCMASYCTSDGCVYRRRSCTSTYLVCASGSCDSGQDRCILNTANCQKPNNTQDCCKENNGQPYCDNENIYNCVCAMDETCCAIYWHSGCTELVKYCSSRDCMKEKIEVPQNTQCSTAKSTLMRTQFSYSLATDLSNVTCDNVTVTEPGLWYKIMGLGTDLTVTTCYGITTGKTSIRVFDSCGGECIVWQATSEECGAQTKVSFPATAFEDYYIFVAIDPSDVVTINFYETYPGNIACKSGNFKIMKDTRAVCPPTDLNAFSESDAEKYCLAQDDCVGFSYDPSTFSMTICTDPKFAYHPQPGIITEICLE